MKIQKYDIFGNPIYDPKGSDELDPFLENFDASTHIPEKPTPKEVVPVVPKVSRAEEYALKKAARQEKYALANALHRTPEEYQLARKLGKVASSAVKKVPKSKLALAALTGGASLAAQAAAEGLDAENANEGENEQLRQMQLERIKGENIAKNPKMRDMYDQADEELRKFGPEDYALEPASDKPQFRQLRKFLR